MITREEVLQEMIRESQAISRQRTSELTTSSTPIVHMEDVELTGDEFGDLVKDLNKMREDDVDSVDAIIRDVPIPESEFDIVDLDQAAKVLSVEDARFIAMTTHIADQMLRASKETEADRAYDSVVSLSNSGLEEIKKSLEAFYPGEWDLVESNELSQFKDQMVNKLLVRSITPEEFFRNPTLTSLRETPIYTIVIHIPEVTVKNDRRRATVIKDLYIFLYLTFNLKLYDSFKVFRGTKTIGEYLCNYNFSHATKGNNSLHGCCLGNTSLDTLVAELRTTSFSPIRFDLLLQQFPDYFSWESIEGGPYITMEELYKTIGGSPQIPGIPSSIPSSVVKKLMLSGYVPEVSITKSRGENVVECKVIVDYELWREVTKHSPKELLFPYVEGTFTNVYPSEQLMTRTNKQIEEINSSMDISGLYFKGKHLKLQVSLNEEKEEEEELNEVTELMADSRLLDAVVRELETSIPNHIQDVYWNGVESCGIKSNTTKAEPAKDRTELKRKANTLSEVTS